MVEMKIKKGVEGIVTCVQIFIDERVEKSFVTGEEEVIKHCDVFLRIKKGDGTFEEINPPKELYDDYLESAKKSGKDTIVGGYVTFNESFTTNVR